ncbi:MAG TPA: helix-turn-helix domain-containing protein [Nonomuraea sp.]|nr:helix-turn-helix domain-containing protein [Nonomuraea sp.]
MNLDELYTADQAAAETGFTRQAIYNWVSRGYLEHAAKQGRTKLFRLEDVFAAEKQRDHTRRRRSSGAKLI